jgi:hypothetical protein
MKNFERLNKNEMKMIVGGVTGCRITVTNSDGSVQTGSVAVMSDDPSGVANGLCVDAIEMGGAGTRCRYDCDHDGWGH